MLLFILIEKSNILHYNINNLINDEIKNRKIITLYFYLYFLFNLF